MTPDEKVKYKHDSLRLFKDNGMTEEEAVVNYVFCINPDPLRWLGHRYGCSEEVAMRLMMSGTRKYADRTGCTPSDHVKPFAKDRKVCKCKRPIVPS